MVSGRPPVLLCKRPRGSSYLGYGLPGTDETAKELLLSNIGTRSDLPDVQVHVILGRNVDTPDVRRLVALLSTVGPSTRRALCIDGAIGPAGVPRSIHIWRHAMGAEDFIPRADAAIQAKRDSKAGNAPCAI